MNRTLDESFASLSTPLLADACVRLDVASRTAPPGSRSVLTGRKLAGRVLPARHAGSVDLFLEAIDSAGPGDVLVVDNGGRLDEGCVGDLVALEAQAAGIRGIVIWGAHRDGEELAEIGLPLWSYGSCPLGPLTAEPRDPDALTSARVGAVTVTSRDVAFADGDGVLFVAIDRVEEVLTAARKIRDRERDQANRVRRGELLRAQLRLAAFVAKRENDPTHTFRHHLRHIGGAVEE